VDRRRAVEVFARLEGCVNSRTAAIEPDAATIVIGCTIHKAEARTTAEKLYRGRVFDQALAYALAATERERIFIVSALYGLLHLDDEAGPYDLTLGDLSRFERRQWGARVRDQIVTLKTSRIVALAGKSYVEPWARVLPPDIDVEQPLARLASGPRFAALVAMRRSLNPRE
jgi:hypothetical protein